MNIKTAIIQFLANEFHLEADNITEDTGLDTDLGLNKLQISDLLRNMQDSLNITLPEEEFESITTVGEILTAIEADEAEEVQE
jgi:acyl carrier protein